MFLNCTAFFVPARLVQERERLGYTREQFACIMDVTPDIQSTMESESGGPMPFHYMRMLPKTGIDVEFIRVNSEQPGVFSFGEANELIMSAFNLPLAATVLRKSVQMVDAFVPGGATNNQVVVAAMVGVLSKQVYESDINQDELLSAISGLTDVVAAAGETIAEAVSLSHK